MIGMLLFSNTLTTFVIAGSLGGIALGVVWTAMRPLLIELSPKKKLGQFFGFLELMDKFSGILGPIVFGFLAVTISYQAATASLAVFFIVGIGFLLKVQQ